MPTPPLLPLGRDHFLFIQFHNALLASTDFQILSCVIKISDINYTRSFMKLLPTAPGKTSYNPENASQEIYKKLKNDAIAKPPG